MIGRLVCALLPWLAAAQTPAGTWDAALTVEDKPVAFQMEFAGDGASLKAAIVDGNQRLWSTSVSFGGGALEVHWDYFDSVLKAQLEDGRLRGSYTRLTRKGLVSREFTARPAGPPAAERRASGGLFEGVWRIHTDDEKGATVMDGRFHQVGDQVTGTIQRVDGDFGTLSGRAVGKQLVLTHFDGIRATRIDAVLTAAGTLAGTMTGGTKFTAARVDEAAALGIPEPPDPTKYTAVKNPAEPFEFRFQDLDGQWVSLADDRFRGKAVIAAITGSWCPNCHDEASFLQDLYTKYRAAGLEIVSLGFEYTGEVERDRGQLRSFARLHGIGWPVLLAGTTNEGEVLRKLPQLANFGGFPTTLYLDRSHRVAAIHAGFAGPANPEEHERLKAETDALVKRLLAIR